LDADSGASELTALLGDWSAGEGPLHRRLSEALRDRIAEGVLEPGRRLPSERSLAAVLAVSRTTVVGAYDALREEGLLSSRRGSGTTVSHDLPPAPTRPWADGMRNQLLYGRIVEGPGDPISLTSITSEGLPEVAEAIAATAREDMTALMAEPTFYPRGMPALREVLAERYTRRGLPTEPDQIVVTTGAQQALNLVAQLFLDRPAATVVEHPGYAGCLDVMRVAGARLLQAPLDDHGVDMRAVRALVREHRPRLIYVMPSYHNPTGVMMTPTRRRELAEFAAEFDIPVVEDSAYTGLRSPQEPPPLAAYAPAGAEVLTLESLDKIAWAGLRLGWMRAPAEIAARLGRRKVLQDLGSPLFEQAVAIRLLAREETLDRARTALLEGRLALAERRLAERMPEWRWRRPDGGAALWIELPEGSDARVLAQMALRHGVEIVPETPGPHGEGNATHFRLPFTLPEPRLDVALDRLARAWDELRRHGPDDAPERVIV
jgi:DNA-binding transcriptional MocR family regulator